MSLLRSLRCVSLLFAVLSGVFFSTGAIYAQAVAPTTAVGTTSAVQTATVTITTAGTLASTAVLTQGSSTLDYLVYSPASPVTGSCSAKAYTVGQTCTVQYTFTPTRPFTRYGSVSLFDGSGNLLGNTFLTGTGTGPQVTYPLSSASVPVALGSGYKQPIGIAVDASGNIYVADFRNSAVKEIVAVGGSIPPSPTIRTLGSGFVAPYGIAVDGAGNVYVADGAFTSVREIVAVSGVIPAVPTIRLLGSGLSGPTGVAVDGAGNVYVADEGDSTVKKISAVNGVIPASPTIVSLGVSGGFLNLRDVAVDVAGNVYVVDENKTSLEKIVAVGGVVSSSSAVVSLGSGLLNPACVGLDGLGDLYVCDSGDGLVKEFLAVGGSVPTGSITPVALGSGYNFPSGVAVDAAGNVYVADTDNSVIDELQVQSPPSLSFASTAVGATSNDSPKTVTVENFGNASLTFPAPGAIGSLNPSISTNFKYSGSSTCTQIGSTSGGFTLAAGSSCKEIVSFMPTVTGSITGSLVSTDTNLNATAATQTVALSGTGSGYLGTVTVSTASITYGTASTTLTASVAYTGPAPTGAVTFVVDAGMSVVATCTGSASPMVCTAAYTTSALSVGSHTITATLAADTNYATYSGTAKLTVTAVTPRLNVPLTSTPYGTTTTTLTVNETFSGAGALPTGTLTVKVDTGAAVTATCSGTASPLSCTAAYATATLNVGNHTIAAAQTADSNYNATTGNGTLVVTAIAPTITFAVPNHTYGDAPFTVSATSNSTGAFTYSVVSGPATITGATVTLTGAGTVVLQASQAAAGNYTAGTQQATFTVAQAVPTITFAVPNHTYGDAPFTVSATSNSTGAFTYSVVSGPATIAAATVTLTGGGTVCLVASEASDTNYLAGTQQACFTVAAEAQTINTSTIISAVTFGTPPVTLTGTASSGLTVTYSYVSGPGSVNGSVLTITGAGTVVLTANQAGNANYLPAPPVTVQITVQKATPVVTWATPAAIGYGTALSATQLDAVVTGVGGTTLTGASVYTPAAGTILGVGAQTLNVTFTPTDATDYTVGAGVTTLIVGRGTPTVTVTTSGTPIFAQNSVTFTAKVSSPGIAATGIVDFVDGTTVIGTGTITSGVATFATSSLAGGSHSITGVYTGDANYGAATSAAVVEVVNDFTLTAATTAQTVLLGATASYPLTVTPVGSTSLAGPVTFTVDGLPAGAGVSFTPSTVAAGAGTTSVTMVIVAPTQLAKLERGNGRGMMYAPVALALLLLPFGRKLRKRAGKLSRGAWVGLLLLVSAATLAGVTGCGSGAPDTPNETFTLTVNATSVTLIHSTTVTLTVQ